MDSRKRIHLINSFEKAIPHAKKGMIHVSVEASKEILTLLKDQQEIVRCRDCKHGSLYCTEDVCGETLIECNRPDLGDVIEIHGWNWFCADGERR